MPRGTEHEPINSLRLMCHQLSESQFLAQFPDVEEVLGGMGPAIKPIRAVRVIWKNGMRMEGEMSAEAAERFIEDAAKSPLVASYFLGMEL